MSRVRPLYVGVGQCSCRRMDVRLYLVPGVKYTRQMMCDRCLLSQGYEVPKPRTASDIVEDVDGALRWKDEG